jgi:hypothetical protein
VSVRRQLGQFAQAAGLLVAPTRVCIFDMHCWVERLNALLEAPTCVCIRHATAGKTSVARVLGGAYARLYPVAVESQDKVYKGGGGIGEPGAGGRTGSAPGGTGGGIAPGAGPTPPIIGSPASGERAGRA